MKLVILKAQWALAIFFVIYSIAVSAQKDPVRYGKIDENDLKMTVYPLDSSAHAVVLCDFGTTNFQYDASGDKGWQVYFKRTVRIKVLDKEGVSAGDFQFKLYHQGNSDKENLSNVDGTTFNLENGKVVKSKLENKNVMKEDEDKNHISVKFAMPNVRAGSVIDVTYTIVSDFVFNLQPWRFQTSFPVKWSEYVINVPEYFIYNHAMLGYNPLIINESSDTRGSIVFTDASRSREGNAVKTTYENTTVDYKIDRLRLAMENVPAFKEEAYLTAADNYRSIYTSELASSKSSDNVYKDYTTNWEKINKLLLESDDFGTAMKRTGYMDAEIDLAIKNSGNETDKMLAVFQLVKDQMRWNGNNSVFSEDFRKAWKEHTGNSGEINLMLIAALRKAGLTVEPIVLSTRSNGILNPAHPSITDLNYVVAQVKISDKAYLLDATEPLAPAGLLPVRCLNNRGRNVKEYNSDWVALSPGIGDKHTAQYTLNLKSDGSLSGTASHVREAYSALIFRKQVAGATSLDDFYKEKEKSVEGLGITSQKVPALDSIYHPLKEDLEFTYNDAAEMSNDRILISPLLFEKTKENPFKLKERLYPVEFPYPVNETLLFTWNIPEGYVVDQLPKPANVVLPDNGGKFSYSITQNGNTISIVSKIQINKTLFLTDEYNLIKEFYNQIITKQAELILLKKG